MQSRNGSTSPTRWRGHEAGRADAVRSVDGCPTRRPRHPARAVVDAGCESAPGRRRPTLVDTIGSSTTPRSVPYDELVRRVHDGPPWWSPLAVPAVADRVNLLEYVVHHEDVRRAGPEPSPPRDIRADRRMAIWSQLRLAARLTLRQAPVGVVLVDPDGDRGRCPKAGGRSERRRERRSGGTHAGGLRAAAGRHR